MGARFAFVRRFCALVAVALAMFVAFAATARAEDAASKPPVAVTKDTPNSSCLSCHGVEGFAVPKGEDGQAPKRHVSLDAHAFAGSAHGKLTCVACHADITQVPHKMGASHSVDCVTCHKDTMATPASAEQKTELEKALAETQHFLASVHAKPSKADPSRPNATCADCHSAHYVFATKSAQGREFRLSTPKVCGRCHEKQAALWEQSVHAGAIRSLGKNGAVCVDCHTAHAISQPKTDPVKLAITRNCGNCHNEQYLTYRDTYHGQVNTLGYANTAKCMDCHEPHDTMKPTAAGAKMSPAKRLETCNVCHKTAPEGFLGFYPHGNNHDFHRYPAMWIASKFMIALLAGVFTFFWSHSALWFYREWRDRKDGVHHILVDSRGQPVAIPEPTPALAVKYVNRWSAPWRIAHLTLAIAVMGLVLTGTTLLYADSVWAPYVIKALGGAKIEAIIHRTFAVVFIILFFGHIGVALYKIFANRSFRWFGSTSLLPNWTDFRDCWGMFKWFFGRGPRPTFDHWTYWEKFDYWAPFWGMFIIGLSGLSLWFPTVAARYLPGWVFNVATIVHGEEAFLAAVFLFTVHYFNCHFRPTKLPQDISMFTGAVPLKLFIEEHGVEYRRLLESGKLDACLVDAPSRQRTRNASILGAILIVVGLLLLTLVLIGFWQKVLFS